MNILGWFRRDPPPPAIPIVQEAAGRVRFTCDGMLPILPDLIPATSWGASLANLLTYRSWADIRDPINQRRHNECQLCGRQTSRIQAHEIWTYRLPPPDNPDAWGVQRLIGIASVCHQCHQVFHLGLANANGTSLVVKARLMGLNRWNDDDFERFADVMWWNWEVRSKVNWALDISLIADVAPLAIDVRNGWGPAEDGQPVLTRPGRKGAPQAVTILLGAPYWLGTRHCPAIDPTEAVEGCQFERGDFRFVEAMGTGLAA